MILNAWCFEENYGGTKLSIEGFEDSTVFLLSRLTTNTVCAYYIDAETARKLYAWYKERQPLIGADWALMLFQSQCAELDRITCIHTEPPIFIHGSVMGYYLPWAETADKRPPDNNALRADA